MHTLGQNHSLPWLVTWSWHPQTRWLAQDRDTAANRWLPSTRSSRNLELIWKCLRLIWKSWPLYSKVVLANPTIYTEGNRSQETSPQLFSTHQICQQLLFSSRCLIPSSKTTLSVCLPLCSRPVLILQRSLLRLLAVKSYLYQMISLRPKTTWSSHT